MKKLFVLLMLCCGVLLFCACGEPDSEKIVGIWMDTETGGTVEYTDDNYYYEYQNENFTSVKTKYSLKNGKIYYYLEDSGPIDEQSPGIKYSFDEDGNLVIEDTIVYTPYFLDKKDKD